MGSKVGIVQKSVSLLLQRIAAATAAAGAAGQSIPGGMVGRISHLRLITEAALGMRNVTGADQSLWPDLVACCQALANCQERGPTAGSPGLSRVSAGGTLARPSAGGSSRNTPDRVIPASRVEINALDMAEWQALEAVMTCATSGGRR